MEQEIEKQNAEIQEQDCVEKEVITKKPLVLVVEDDLLLLEAIETMLRKYDLDVVSARSVERAFGAPIKDEEVKKVTVDMIQKAIKHLADLERVKLVWLDHNLIGKENGVDFVKKLKANGGKWEKIPILVVSNTSDVELRKKYLDIGVSHYFVKAENRLSDIVTKVKSLVENKNN